MRNTGTGMVMDGNGDKTSNMSLHQPLHQNRFRQKGELGGWVGVNLGALVDMLDVWKLTVLSMGCLFVLWNGENRLWLRVGDRERGMAAVRHNRTQ